MSLEVDNIMKKNKVFGYNDSFDKKRYVVATTSKSKATKLILECCLANKTSANYHWIWVRIAETGNENDIKNAMSFVGSVISWKR